MYTADITQKILPYRCNELAMQSDENIEQAMTKNMVSQHSYRSASHWTVKMMQLSIELAIRSNSNADLEDILEDIENDFANDFFQFAEENKNQ